MLVFFLISLLFFFSPLHHLFILSSFFFSSSSLSLSHSQSLYSSIRLTDEELLEACGGLTGHRAARHGLSMAGKLRRMAEADAMLYVDEEKENETRKVLEKGGEKRNIIRGRKS